MVMEVRCWNDVEKGPELRNGGVSRSWKCQENNLVLWDQVHDYWKHSVRHPGPGGTSLQKQHWFWATGRASKRRKSTGRLGCSVKKKGLSFHLTNPRIFFLKNQWICHVTFFFSAMQKQSHHKKTAGLCLIRKGVFKLGQLELEISILFLLLKLSVRILVQIDFSTSPELLLLFCNTVRHGGALVLH